MISWRRPFLPLCWHCFKLTYVWHSDWCYCRWYRGQLRRRCAVWYLVRNKSYSKSPAEGICLIAFCGRLLSGEKTEPVSAVEHLKNGRLKLKKLQKFFLKSSIFFDLTAYYLSPGEILQRVIKVQARIYFITKQKGDIIYVEQKSEWNLQALEKRGGLALPRWAPYLQWYSRRYIYQYALPST